jgi:hypothetical protein
MIKIDVESDQLISRNKKDGSGVYYQQEAFAHTSDQYGNPKRYPEQIFIFPQRDAAGSVVAYKPGTYKLAQQSLRVVRNQIELGFPVLVPIGQK